MVVLVVLDPDTKALDYLLQGVSAAEPCSLEAHPETTPGEMLGAMLGTVLGPTLEATLWSDGQSVVW